MIGILQNHHSLDLPPIQMHWGLYCFVFGAPETANDNKRKGITIHNIKDI